MDVPGGLNKAVGEVVEVPRAAIGRDPRRVARACVVTQRVVQCAEDFVDTCVYHV